MNLKLAGAILFVLFELGGLRYLYHRYQPHPTVHKVAAPAPIVVAPPAPAPAPAEPATCPEPVTKTQTKTVTVTVPEVHTVFVKPKGKFACSVMVNGTWQKSVCQYMVQRP